jgi:hypothetical protein
MSIRTVVHIMESKLGNVNFVKIALRIELQVYKYYKFCKL